MTKKELAELLKYCSSKRLYVVPHNNKLTQLFCPFQVVVLRDIGSLKKGDVVLVDEVKVTLELKTVFIVERRAYFYYYFEIIVEPE